MRAMFLKPCKAGAFFLFFLLLCPHAPGGGALAKDVDFAGHAAKSKQTTAYFATTSTLSLYGPFDRPEEAARFDAAWSGVKEMMAEVEAAVSLSMPDSDISRFNALAAGESMEVSAHTARIVQIAKEAHRETGGWFDPTVYPLVDLWGFTPRFNSLYYQPTLPYDRAYAGEVLPLPDIAYVDGLAGLIGFDGITLSGGEAEGHTLTKNTPPVEIGGTAYQAQMDLAGVAKGYVADLALSFLREMGFEYGYFSCGGSSMALMRNGAALASGEGAAYRIGVRKPRPGREASLSSYARVLVEDMALSTSGDYDHSYAVDEVLYCHIINPFTGWPANRPEAGEAQRGAAIATLFLESAAWGDCVTTALCAMPFEEMMAYLNGPLRGAQAIVALYEAGRDAYEVITSIPAERLELQDGAYQLASAVDAAGQILYTGEIFPAYAGQ